MAGNDVEILLGNSDGLKMTLTGCKDLPLIEAVLAPGAKMLSEPGRTVSLPEGVEYKAVMGTGEEAGMMSMMMSAASRMFSGESVIMAQFENTTGETKLVRFGTAVPGHVVHLNLPDYGGEIIGMSGVFLMGSHPVKIASCFRQKLGAAFFGGESLILQKITGSGSVLLQAGGALLEEKLTPERPSIRVDTGCLVAFTSKCVYNVALAGGLKSMFFGGEGLFHATVSLAEGETEATVWVESFPFSKFIEDIKAHYSH
eukprot:gb/GFBE01066494.1/.p1 GENE.gb/GFBE01066494.1/~~gb/GFBE01066494.1/.p1  ORF type:complete len:257 (+),score=62.02 gb/GFBE01066494.1/:1-771(+)